MGYDQDFKNKTVLVTGGSRGIGKAIAESLLFYGAEVTILGRNQENLTSFQKAHPSVKTICVDLSDWEKTSQALSNSGQTFDFLVNCAGVCVPASFLKATAATFESTLKVNVGSVFAVSQIVAKGMIANNGGSIVNISSMASTSVFPNLSIYSCSKAGLDMVTKCMAVELGPHGIRVNSVNCGGVDTDMAREVGKIWVEEGWAMDEGDATAKRFPLKADGPMGMVGMDQVVQAVLFLLSPRTSRATTGTMFFVDNGYIVG